MLEAVVNGYAEGLSQRSQCLGGAGALPRLNLGKVYGIDTGGSSQLGLGHIAMIPIHPNRVLPSQEPLNSQTKCNTKLRCCHGNSISAPHH